MRTESFTDDNFHIQYYESMENFLKSITSKKTKITQGIRDSIENIMPNVPAEDGTIMKNPETKPHKPIDFLN